MPGPFKPVKPGQYIGAARINALQRMAWAGYDQTTAPPNSLVRLPGGATATTTPTAPMIPVRITDAGRDHTADPYPPAMNCYGGVQILSDTDGSVVDVGIDDDFNITNSAFPLVELDGRSDVPLGAMAWAWPSPRGTHYEFVAFPGGGADVQQIRTTGAATTIDGFKFYPGYTQELDPDGTSSGVMGFLDVTAVALMQYSNYDLTVTGAGGCYTARRHTRIESVTLGGNPYPVYVTTEFPSLRPDCTVGN